MIQLSTVKSQSQSQTQSEVLRIHVDENIYLCTLLIKQECIPVGCVPPGRYRMAGLCPGGSLSKGYVSVWRVSVQGGLCPLCGHLSKHNLRKLPLRAVINKSIYSQFYKMAPETKNIFTHVYRINDLRH